MTTPYWTRVLDELAPARVKRGKPPFTAENIRRAGIWTDCGCGKQDPRIPRYCGGKPRDIELGDAGEVFSLYVQAQNLEGAREALARIEVRAPEVLAAALAEIAELASLSLRTVAEIEKWERDRRVVQDQVCIACRAERSCVRTARGWVCQRCVKLSAAGPRPCEDLATLEDRVIARLGPDGLLRMEVDPLPAIGRPRVSLSWRRDYDGVRSDWREAEAATIEEGLRAILDYEDREDGKAGDAP